MNANKYYLINYPIVNLMSECVTRSKSTDCDERQETQLLWGDLVYLIDNQGDWSYIEAVDQAIFKEGNWSGYRGWVPSSSLIKSDCYKKNAIGIGSWIPCFADDNDDRHNPTFFLSIGSFFHVVSLEGENARIRQGRQEWWIPSACLISLNSLLSRTLTVNSASQPPHVIFANSNFKSEALGSIALARQCDPQKTLVEFAKKFLNSPYRWGARSMYSPDLPFCGVDCSGLTSLVYRLIGIALPRNAHDQFLVSHAVSPEELQLGDLIFTSKNPNRYTHVMLYAGNGRVIDSSSSYGGVHESELSSRVMDASSIAYGRILSTVSKPYKDS